MSAWAVVVAAGKGERAGFAGNKVFQPIGGRSVLGRCLGALEAARRFDGAVLVLSRRDFARYEQMCAAEGRCALVKRVVEGGETRQDSVYNGLLAVPEEVEIVAVHDAARPFVTADIVERCLEAARRSGSGVACAPVADTIKQILPDGRVSTPDRARLRAAQTPQAFRRAEILRACEAAREQGWTATDDAELYARCRGGVTLCESPDAARNIKLTTPEDFARANSDGSAFRVGMGYDAHRLTAGRPLVLCGVTVPYERGLDGHSDADVAVHALMDALLGAMGEGDIGRHFPDGDPAYQGISSMLLLARVVRMAKERGFCVVNADVTIVAQRPRLAPYIEQMRLCLAEALGVSPDRAGVKATTTEHMGFEGREEGISAQAAALLTKGWM